MKEVMIRSLREPAATVLRGLPTNVMVKEILRHMEQRCDPTNGCACHVEGVQ